ncbi:transposase [Acinetobacter sp. TGL-Y2]|uniref:IS630 transposase-related protein n=1 Tax=Acinetobacter sp. TGL-Y2 TaxID=1407071 RepID=UPI0007A6508D|nr:IS630 transposase-related protein [Acinetobacter sp. TGL-Y2]AMW80262.1 transposase [Acinetobacter sp. TGL-Y2]
MPEIYSVDLREKVMQFYQENNHKSHTYKTFKISWTTLDDWIFLQNTTGELKQPKINAGRPTKIKDMDVFKHFVQTTEFSQVKDLIPLFEQKFGYPILYSTLLKAIHRLGWTRKKRVFSTSKPIK